MRVGDASFYLRFLAGLDRNRTVLSRATEQLADGKRVRRGSDDPAGAQASLALRGRLVQIEGFDRSAQTARFDLATLDNTLGEIVNNLSTARTEAMAGASNINSDANIARALTIDGLRERLVALGNTYQNGRYLLGGTATRTAPFAADGTYLGNDDEVEAPIDVGEEVGSTISGRRVFQGTQDILQILEDVATALRNQDANAVGAQVAALKQAIDDVSAIRSEIGTRMIRIDAALSRHQDEVVHLARRIGEIEDVNLEQAIAELQAADTSRAALSAAAGRVLGRSLFDYLG